MDPFLVHSLSEAKRIILTPEDSTTERRWAVETPYLADLIEHHCPSGATLDYGCGVGRMARELIARKDRFVLGVDASPSMRALAAAYVEHPHFAACAPELVPHPLCGAGLDVALGVWALQHIASLREAIERIRASLRPAGRLFVVNNHRRALPNGRGGWFDDGIDVRTALREHFGEIAVGDLDPARTTPTIGRAAFWGVYERR